MSFLRAVASAGSHASRAARQPFAVRTSTLLVAVGGCLFTMLAVSGETKFKSGEWSGGAVRGESGAIYLCMASNRQQDQTPRLYVAMDENHEAMIALVGTSWGPWKEDTEVPIKIRIGASYIDADTATAIDSDRKGEQVLILPAGFEQLLTERPDGQRLSVETSKGATAISVNGLRQVLTELKGCISSDATQGTAKSQDARLEANAPTILSCRFNDKNAGHSTLTVKFDEASQNIVGRGNVDAVSITDTKIAWREPLGEDSWRVFSVERYSGAITMYGPPYIFQGSFESSREYQRKVENARRDGLMDRIATGSCEVVNDRKF